MSRSEKAEEFKGGDGSAYLRGNLSDNDLYVLGGADRLDGAEENERLFGGLGDDRFSDAFGYKEFFGGAGNDTLYGQNGNDSFYGGSGDDTFDFEEYLDFDGAAEIYGGDGIDTLLYGHSEDSGTVVLSFADPTAVNVMPGGQKVIEIEKLIYSAFSYKSQTITGGVYGDSITCYSNKGDFLYGADGNDTIESAAMGALSILDGGSGDDLMIFHDRFGDGVQILGGAGIDTFQWDLRSILNNSGVQLLFADLMGTGYNTDGTLISGMEKLVFIGSDGNDSVTGGSLSDTLQGASGLDRLVGGDGNDLIEGGRGGDVTFGGDGDDTLGGEIFRNGSNYWSRSDNYHGGSGNDVIETGNGGDRLFGGTGDDSLYGGAGFDTLSGGAGLDRLAGGRSADSFVFDTPIVGGTVDVIVDFEAGSDRLVLSAAQFGGQALGFLQAAEFEEGTIATAASTRIVYDATTGTVAFDVDGVGGAAAVAFALVAANTALTAAEIEFV